MLRLKDRETGLVGCSYLVQPGGREETDLLTQIENVTCDLVKVTTREMAL